MNSREYPRFIMAGMMTGPVAATSATAEPEISAKNMDCTMFTCARPPRMNPTSATARSISRCVIDDEFMIAPARMNIGIASSGKLVAPSNMTSARFGSMWEPWVSQIAPTAITPSATAIGTLIITSAASATIMRGMAAVTARPPCAGSRSRHVPRALP